MIQSGAPVQPLSVNLSGSQITLISGSTIEFLSFSRPTANGAATRYQNQNDNPVAKSGKSGTINPTKPKEEIKVHAVGNIDENIFEKHFGKLQTNEVVVMDERIQHIKEHHPEDYELFEKYKESCLSVPDFIITDERSVGTVYMIKKLDNTNLNVVLRLALATDKDGLKNSIMTFWRIRDKNVKKLAEKNKVLYKNE